MDRFDVVNSFRKFFYYIAIAVVIILFIFNISTSMFAWAYFGRAEPSISGAALLMTYLFALLVRLFVMFLILSTLSYFVLKLMKIHEERKIMKLLERTPEKIREEEIVDVKQQNGKKSSSKRSNKKREVS